jgi:hypothetical protein
MLRRPRPAAGKGFHGLLDAGNAPLDVLHVQPPRDNLIVSDAHHADSDADRPPGYVYGRAQITGAAQHRATGTAT